MYCYTNYTNVTSCIIDLKKNCLNKCDYTDSPLLKVSIALYSGCATATQMET